ncbi:MAG: trehalose-phosphatase [Acidimicrobiales bacterium]
MIAPFLQAAAVTDRLLLATDFDGVLAPIVDDPAAVAALPESMHALRRLAALPNTTVAVVSGRGYEFLERLVAPADAFTLVGSHGAELANEALGDAEQIELDRMVGALNELAERYPGFHVETKSVSVAAHLRRVEQNHDEVAADLDSLVGVWPGKIVAGKQVVEFTLRHTTKGDAVMGLASRHEATATIYFGDDVTDEDVFVVLGPDDVGVKVGQGETAALNRVTDPGEVCQQLTALASARAAHCTAG